MLLLIGSDDALLEGLSQALATAGHRVVTGHTLEDAADLAGREPPALLIVDRALVGRDAELRLGRVAIAAGGAIVTYHGAGDGPVESALSPATARHHLADLELPLERARLVALADRVSSRTRTVGRPAGIRPPEPPAI